MSIKLILERKGSSVTSIRPDASVRNAADVMYHARIAALPIKVGDLITGLFTDRDLVAAVSEFGQRALAMPVKHIASSQVIAIAPTDSIERAMRLMTRHRVRHLPVIENGKLLGIVSIGDIVKNRLGDLELETNVLRDAYRAAHAFH